MELAKNEFVKNKVNTKFLKALSLFLLFFVLCGINNAYVYYASLTPFGISVVFSLFYIGFNGYVLGGLYCVSVLILSLSLSTVLQGLNVAIVLCIIEWLRTNKAFSIKKWYLFILMLPALVSYVVTSYYNDISILAIIVSIVLSLLFLLSSVTFLDATIGKGLLTKINLDEKICGCIILLIFSMGICGSFVYIFNLGLIFSIFIILCINRLSTPSVAIITAVLIGCGFAIYLLNPIYVSFLTVLAVIAIAFKCNCKYLSAIGVVLGYILFAIFFELGIVTGDLLSVVLGSILYLTIPKKLFEQFSNVFTKTKIVAMSNVFNNGKKELVNRIKNLSKVFKEMDKAYRDMVRGCLSDATAKSMLKDELIQGVCLTCDNKDICYRDICSYMDESINTIVSVGYEKQKLSLIDLPEFLTTNCCKVGALIQYFNNLISSYFDYKNSINNVDTSRVLIAEQLGAVSTLLETLSSEVDINVSMGNAVEETIKERLSYAGVLCLECVVYERSASVKIINLIVKKSQYNNNKIIKIVNKVLSSKYKISSVTDSSIACAVDIVLTNSPNYDIVFGCSLCAKNGKVISGDNHSVVAISDDKYMVSICDGMGSGNTANNISKLTLSLIECFYRAGFDNETILSSTNKILSLNESENFSTIDLCLIDTRKNIYDFIKLAACNGYIKRNTGDVEVVASSGLPIGVIDNISPHITKSHINNMDMVVLVSDGVGDVLGDNLQFIISTIDTINPQTMSDEILSRAIMENGGVSSDDMTVVCVRVFESV